MMLDLALKFTGSKEDIEKLQKLILTKTDDNLLKFTFNKLVLPPYDNPDTRKILWGTPQDVKETKIKLADETLSIYGILETNDIPDMALRLITSLIKENNLMVELKIYLKDTTNDIDITVFEYSATTNVFERIDLDEDLIDLVKDEFKNIDIVSPETYKQMQDKILKDSTNPESNTVKYVTKYKELLKDLIIKDKYDYLLMAIISHEQAEDNVEILQNTLSFMRENNIALLSSYITDNLGK